jgi:hypothetical protein
MTPAAFSAAKTASRVSMCAQAFCAVAFQISDGVNVNICPISERFSVKARKSPRGLKLVSRNRHKRKIPNKMVITTNFHFMGILPD